MKRRVMVAGPLLSALFCLAVLASAPADTDWPMWGGAPERNMVSDMRDLPVSWDLEKKQNVKWTAKLGSQTYGNPVVTGGQVYIGTNNELALNPKEPGDRGVLMCFREADGQFLWQHTHEKLEDRCDETVHGIRISDGEQVVSFPSGGFTGASMVLDDKRAYYGTFDNEVFAVDLVKKSVLWRYGPGGFPFYSSAAFGGDRIVLGGRDKLVHAIDTRTGKAIWTFRTRARVDSSPAIAGGRVYIGSNDGRFYVLDLASGKKLWEFEGGAPLVASPAIGGGRIVIGDHSGHMFCFGQ